MKKKNIFILLFGLLMTINAYSQESELFSGEQKFNSCKVDIPLTYKNKDKPAYTKGAQENKDVELVLLNYDKKTKKATYSFYYIVVNEVKATTFVYLKTPESHNSNTKEKQVFFPPFNVKYDRFYKADCFLKILSKNPELKEIITKGD